jgi:Carboxymuconolactone decarboxylase family
MANSVYPPASRELSQKRRALAHDIEVAFDAFSQRVFADGTLPAKTKQVIAVAVAHVTQCPYCIGGFASRRNATGAHGSHLGGRRDAGWRRLRSFGSIRRSDGRSYCLTDAWHHAIGNAIAVFRPTGMITASAS